MTPWYAALTPAQREAIPYQDLDLDTQEAVPEPFLNWETVKQGMRVRVVRACESYSNGWRNTWYSPAGLKKGMDSYVNNGVVYTIDRIYDSSTGVEFVEDTKYCWPPHALLEVHDD